MEIMLYWNSNKSVREGILKKFLKKLAYQKSYPPDISIPTIQKHGNTNNNIEMGYLYWKNHDQYI